MKDRFEKEPKNKLFNRKAPELAVVCDPILFELHDCEFYLILLSTVFTTPFTAKVSIYFIFNVSNSRKVVFARVSTNWCILLIGICHENLAFSQIDESKIACELFISKHCYSLSFAFNTNIHQMISLEKWLH